MKAGAKTFIDIIEEATDGVKNGQIGSGSRIGIVSFADTATVNAPLITSVDTLKDAVDSLTAGGSTNHADAFTKAAELFDPASSNARVMVMFTDGNTTAGAPPAPVAAAARAQGIIIYCIGLVGSDGVDVDTLNEWATDPDASHVAITPDAADLEALFAQLAANISKPGATDIVINETVMPDFVITSIMPPTKGSAAMLGTQSLRWSIPQLGVTASESAVLEFFIRHVAQTSGTKPVNESITYSDTEGNTVSFPAPTVAVDLGDTYLESQGRILQLNTTIKHVCPGKRVALAVILTEVDAHGTEYQRGMKAMTIPAHHEPSCRDVEVKCIQFVVPEDLDVSGGPAGAMCNPRYFKVRLIAHNIDTDYRCCDSVVTLSME